MEIIKKADIKDVQKLEPSHIVGGNVKYTDILEKRLAFPQTVKHRVTR